MRYASAAGDCNTAQHTGEQAKSARAKLHGRPLCRLLSIAELSRKDSRQR
jgi:hypothetical protein